MTAPDFWVTLKDGNGDPLSAEQWEQLKDGIVRSDPRLDALLAVVRSAEWHQQRWNGVPSCPICGGYKPTGAGDEPLEGHRQGCALRDALAAFEEPV